MNVCISVLMYTTIGLQKYKLAYIELCFKAGLALSVHHLNLLQEASKLTIAHCICLGILF